MKSLSRTDVLLGIVLTILLLAGAGFLRESILKHHSEENGQFTKNYLQSIQKLTTSMSSIQRLFDKNSCALIEIQDPVALRIATLPPEGGAFSVLLQGISWNADTPLALISDRVYRVNDRIGGYRLEEIQRNSIQLRDSTGKVIEIHLMEEVRP